MVVAYVMVKAFTGEAERLKREIEAVSGVVSAHIVAGDVDVIARVNVETPADVRRVAATDIQKIDGVEDTQTYIAME